MKLKTLPVGALRTNCYLVYDDKNLIIIDPGDDADYIIRTISDLDITPQAIIATHGHYDHITAVNELKLAFNVPFLMHQKDELLFKWYRKSARRFAGFDPGPAPKVDQYLEQNLLIFTIIETPGHTPGGVTPYNKKDKIAFVGDTVFAGGAVGRTDFDYCSKVDLDASIEKLLALPRETIVYPGHGKETTIGELRKFFIQ